MSGKRKNYDFNQKNEIMYKLESGKDTKSNIADQYGIPLEYISRWWKEFSQNGEFTDPGNRNDAIPSWSGFNFQGKVMILCVLQKINNQYSCSNIDLKNICVELEKLQDFIFKENGVPVSLWQVKATLSKNSLNSYNDALEKIIEDKQNCGNDDIECFLISAIDIEDWDKNNIYSSQVNLYKYKEKDEKKNKIVGICDVDIFIKKELEKVLDYLLIDKDYIEQIYLALCNFIDIKVAEFHDIGKSSTYEICFTEFVENIKNSSMNLIDIQELKEKENYYKRISELIHDNINAFCNDECNMELQNCSQECAILRNYKYLQTIDLAEYVQVILPDKHGEDIRDFYWTDKTIYEENICEVLKNSSHNSTFSDDNKIFIKVNKGKTEIIPTLMSFRKNNRGQEKRISEKLKSIETNEFVINKIGNGILSAYTDEAIFQTEGDKFTTINLSEILDDEGNITNEKVDYYNNIMNRKSGFKKFTNTTNNIFVIDCEIIKEYLRGANRNE